MATAIKNKKLVKNKPAPKALAISTLAGLLAACNSDNDNAVVQTTTLSGAVVKGPLQGALVYADADGDGVQGINEVGFTTLEDGSYTITSTNAAATIVATTTANTIDTSSGEQLSGVTLKAPAGATVVTPATTILEAQPDIEPAQLAVALGIPTTASDGSAIDLTSFNPYAADADPEAALAAEKAAQQVMVTIKAVSSAAEGAGMEVEDAFELAMTSIADVVAVEAAKIDTSSAESIAAAEASVAAGTGPKVDFSDSTLLEEVSTSVKTLVAEVAADDASITIDEDAFSAVLASAVTAVENVNAAIEAITDTDLTSSESMGVFATLTDVASEIKAAAEAEVQAPGSGAALVTFTDAAAVSAAADEAAAAIVETAAAEEVPSGGEAVAEEVVDESSSSDDSSSSSGSAAPADFDTEKYFVVDSLSGASWSGGAAGGAQDLTVNIQGTTLDVTADVQVEADDFTGAFSNTSAATDELGVLSITNLRGPISGSQDDREVTVTINSVAAPGDPGTLGKIVVGFTLDWSMSGDVYTVSSDDSSLDITYTQYDNSSVTVNMANAGTADNLLAITKDDSYSGNSTLNIDALSFITHLNATGDYLFTDLESRFALPNTTLEVDVDVSNLNVYNSVLGSDVNNITATIDIV